VFAASGKGRLYSYVIHHRGAGLHATLCDRRRRVRRGAAPDDQHHRLSADPRGAGARHAGRGRLRQARRRHHSPPLSLGEKMIAITLHPSLRGAEGDEAIST